MTQAQFRAALVRAGFSGAAGGIGPDTLEQWYSGRITSEGRWRTFARILSDSGDACSSALHAQALGSTHGAVWRYFFDYVPTGSLFPGSTHGADESWLLGTQQPHSQAEADLSADMGHWWASLGASGDPNSADGAPRWSRYAPVTAPLAMFMQTPPALNTSIDTVRAECEHWKPFLGW